MDLDVERLLGAVERTVSSLERDAQAARAATLARGYPTGICSLSRPHAPSTAARPGSNAIS